jgi:hypothetical protein
MPLQQGSNVVNPWVVDGNDETHGRRLPTDDRPVQLSPLASAADAEPVRRLVQHPLGTSSALV